MQRLSGCGEVEEGCAKQDGEPRSDANNVAPGDRDVKMKRWKCSDGNVMQSMKEKKAKLVCEISM